MGFFGPMGPAGFRRRGRRRGLVVGAAAGAAVASRRNATNNAQQGAPQEGAQTQEADNSQQPTNAVPTPQA